MEASAYLVERVEQPGVRQTSQLTRSTSATTIVHYAQMVRTKLVLPFFIDQIEQEHGAFLSRERAGAHSPRPCFAQLPIEQAPHIG